MTEECCYEFKIESCKRGKDEYGPTISFDAVPVEAEKRGFWLHTFHLKNDVEKRVAKDFLSVCCASTVKQCEGCTILVYYEPGSEWRYPVAFARNKYGEFFSIDGRLRNVTKLELDKLYS